MNIWSTEAAADFFGDAHAAEIERCAAERKACIEHVANAITKIADHQTKIAMLCLLALVEKKI